MKEVISTRKSTSKTKIKTQALSVALDKSGLYTEFPIGAKVQLRLKGLTTQLNNAITEIGYKIYKNEKSGRESVGSMAEAIYKTHLYDMGGERKTLASLAKEVTSIETVKKRCTRRTAYHPQRRTFP